MMKNRWKWGAVVALPLLLIAAILAAKWKRENPTLTPKDQAIQSRLSKLNSCEVRQIRNGARPGSPDGHLTNLEIQSAIKRTYIVSNESNLGIMNGWVVDCGNDIQHGGIYIIDEHVFVRVDNGHGEPPSIGGRLHPVSARAWRETVKKFAR